MRLSDNPQMPLNPESPYDRVLARFLAEMLKNINQKVNGLADGRLAARDLTAGAMPSSGYYSLGDFVANHTPTELGSAGSRYLVTGWMCVASGAPGLFRECRVLTGS